MDVPGIDKANLEIKVKDKLLIVSGKREQQRENIKDNNTKIEASEDEDTVKVEIE